MSFKEKLAKKFSRKFVHNMSEYNAKASEVAKHPGNKSPGLNIIHKHDSLGAAKVHSERTGEVFAYWDHSKGQGWVGSGKE